MTQRQLRRYDIDWLRIIAIFLLIFYHTAIVYQPFAQFIYFIQSSRFLPGLWWVMEGLNIWRIPLLFFVSGMGLYFSMARREYKALLRERSVRILIPLIFGSFAIVPIHGVFLAHFLGQPATWFPNVGHLWFLLNIFIYVLLFAFPLIHLRRWATQHPDIIKNMAMNPIILYVLASPLVLEAWLMDPEFYSLFAGTPHGFWVGLLGFVAGFGLVLLGDPAWNRLNQLKYVHLLFAIGLFLVRMKVGSHNILVAIEAIFWMFSAFGLAYRFLRRPNKVQAYLSSAVFPIYIIHMAFLYGLGYFILKIDLPGSLSFVVLCSATMAGSLIFYEIIRRVPLVRLLFGMKR